MTTYELAKTECWKCGGRKYILAYAGIAGGVCFACNGVGFRYDSAKAVDAFTAKLPRKTTGELVAGDRVQALGVTLGGDTYHYWTTVESVDAPSGLVCYRDKYTKEVVQHHASAETTWLLAYNRDTVQSILAELAPRFKGGILVDGVKRTAPRKSDAEKEATKAAAKARKLHANPASEKQIALIASYGIEPLRPVSSVEASQLIDRLFSR